ncbi:MAG TPA: autotransporter-associated beta strand repeat-containing protein [Lacibacter sp.]|nr:autotransporter-associated beta strand repeat-containing protein [Lacibacter sp.]
MQNRILLSASKNSTRSLAIAQPQGHPTPLHRRSLQVLLLMALLLSGVKGWGQQNVFWRTEAANGNWENGNCAEIGSGNSQWWYPGFSPNQARNRPDCSDGSTTRHNVEIGNNHQTTMTLNTAFWGLRQLTLTSGASSNRTFNSSPDDNTRGVSFTFGLFNDANSGVTHTFNSRIGIDASTVILRTTTSGATTIFNREIFGNSNTIQFDGSGATTVTGVISGSGASVSKQGGGILTLSGANSYTGATTISGGTLFLGATGSGSNSPLGTTAAGTTVSSGGVLDLNGFTLATAEGLTLNGTGISSGGALVNNTGTAVSWSGGITLGSASSIGGSGQITLSGVVSGSNALTKVGSNTLILSGTNTYTGATTVSAGTIRLNNTAALGTTAAGTSVTSGAVLDLNGVNYTTAEALTINGTGISSGGALINSNATGATFGGLITLGSSSSIVGGTGTINISNTGTITGSGFGLTLGGAQGGTIASIIGTGTGTVTKQDAGTWVLTGANTYTGLTTVSAGTLQLNRTGGTTIPNTNNVTISGGTLRISTNQTIANLTMSSGTLLVDAGVTLTITGSYSVTGGTINNQGTIVLQGTSSHSFPGASVSNMNNLTINNTGVVTNTATYTIAGTLAVNNGSTFTLNSGITSTTTVLQIGGSIAGSATLTLAGDVTVNTAGSTSAQISCPVALGASTRTFTVADGSPAADLTVSGIIGGTGGLTKAGDGTMVLTGTNTYSGTTTISAGVLQVGNNGTAGTLGSGGVTNNASLVFNRSDDITVANLIGGTGSVTKLGAGVLTFTANNTYSGGTTITAGTLKIGNNGTTGSFGSGNVTNNGNLVFDRSNALTVSNIISGSGSVTKQAAGNLTLSGANTYAGNTNLNAGTLTLSVANAIGSSSPVIVTAGTLALGTTSQNFHSLTMSGGEVTRGGSSAPLTLNNASSLTGGTISITSGTGDKFVFNSDLTLGNVTINSTATTGTPFSGIVLGGTVTINAGTTPVLSNTGGGAVRMNLNNANRTFSVGSGGSLDITWPIFSSTPSSGALTKTGTGTLTLSGASTYTGATTISAGTLNLTGSLASAITADASGTLTGTGSTTGAITVNGVISPAGSGTVGTLTTSATGTSAVVFAAGGTYTLDVNGFTSSDADRVVSGGAINISGSFTINANLSAISGTFDAADPYTWVIGTYTSGTPAVSNLVLNVTGISNFGAFSVEAAAGELRLVHTPFTSISLSALGTAYTQDFNSLKSTGTGTTSDMPTGWTFNETGSGANNTYNTGSGTNNNGDTYSFGTTSDRTLGGLQSGTVNPSWGASFTNNTGSTINSLTITYTGKTWRVAETNRSDRIDFQYSTNATSLTTGSWTNQDELDYTNPGQAQGNGSLQHSATITYTITGLSINNGSTFWVRWLDFDASGADDGMGVDDFNITPCTNFSAGAINTTGETVCENGDPGVIGSATAASGGDNNIIYKWQANGVDIPSSNSATYDPPSGISVTTTFTRFARGTNCSTDWVQSTGSWVVTVTPPPTTANAGPNQTGAATCGLTQVTLAANTPTVGTGSWSIVSGTGGSFGNANSPTSTFSGTSGETYLLRWTISNSPCTASTSDVTITFNQNPTAANAGPDQTGIATCGLTQVTLAANTPTIGTGSWSIVSGTGGSFGNASSPTSTFIGTAGETYVLKWTISNSPCTASEDEVTITFNINPTAADAGPDQTGAATCGLTQVTLAANTPSVGTGSWSIVAGTGGSFGNSASPTSTFSGVAGNTYTLRWTTTNGVCTSTDDVVITFNQNPTTANAGPDQTGAATCGLTQVTLAANTPTVGTGSWSIVSGTGGSFGNASSPTSTFSGTAGETYVLRWTISNSPCTASTSDVTVTFNRNPTTANAGPNQTSSATCGLTQVTLAANTPTVGTGSWSIVSGTGGSFGNASSPSSTFSGTAGTTYVLRWTISNSPCTASTSDVTITFNQNPTTANAGSNQTICAGTSATLAANTPSVGTGAWTILGGSPNTNTNQLSSTTSPTATFTPTAAGTYTLRWTISNSPCTASTSDVTITVSSTITWVGGTSTNWHTASNWSCGSVPSASTDVVIPTGTTFSPDISTANANARSVTINSSATLTMSGNFTLTVAANGAFTNNGTFTATAGTVSFAGAGSVAGSSTTTFNNLTITTGELALTTVPTINGIFQINGGNVNAGPRYGSSSTLRYNVSYTRFNEWNASGVGTIGSTPGYPNNVEIATGTFNLKNTTNTARALHGSLTVASGATFNMGDITSALTVRENVTINGTMNLSTANGGDVNVGGNWTVGASGAQNNNTRAVFFNAASGDQTVTRTGGGIVYFDYLIINKAAGNVVISSSPATDIEINTTAGQVLQLNNAGALDLNGRILRFNNAGGEIRVNAANRSITSSVAGGRIDFNEFKSVTNGGTGNLVIGSNVTVNLNANGNVNFGSSLTTINGTLAINSNTNCFVNTNPPIYGSNSFLVYNSGGTYGRGLEWSATSGAGYPANVTVNSGTSVNMGANSGTGTARQMSGNLLVNGGFFMDFSSDDMTQPVTVLGNVTIAGTLSLSDAAGGDFVVRGNWTNTGTFNPKVRLVTFSGTTDQTITRSGGETFDFVTVNKASGNLVLANNVTFNRTLTLTNGDVVTGSNRAIISSTGDITAGSNASHINGNLQRHFATGSNVARSYPIGDGTNLTTATVTLGSVSTAGSIVLRTDASDHPQLATYGLNPTKYLRRWWTATNVGSAFSSGSIQFNYLAGDLQGGAVSANLRAARYTTTPTPAWAYPASSTASNQITVNGLTNGTLEQSYTAGECLGDITFTPTNNGPLCEGSTLSLNSGSITGGIGTLSYAWTGPSSFSSALQNPTRANVVLAHAGSYTLTVSDAAGCSNANGTTVAINAAPTTSNAGSNQTVCISAGSVTLAANNPSVGIGTWSIVSGPSSDLAQFSPNTGVNNATFTPAGGPGVYTLRWTITNAPCTASISDVVITFDALPTTANAGPDQELCNTSTFTLAGNNPAVGTGVWSIITGPGSITNASLFNTTVTGVTAGSKTVLRWTISNGTCSDSFDEVELTNVAPPTTANAGPDQEQCNDGTFTLAGNTPTVGTGVWTLISGTATIVTPGSPTSEVNGVPVGTSATLQWTITNGICPESSDLVVLTNSVPPDVADAGPDQAQCQNGTFTLAGNNPTAGTGVWTLEAGTATITNPNAFNTTVTGVPAGTSATLRWTITSGTCPPSFDEVVLTNSNPPNSADAGPDQGGCSSGFVTLAANAPGSGVTGTWSVVSGPSTLASQFNNVNSNTATFTPAGGAGLYILRWTLSTPGCTASTDDVEINVVLSPTTAAAGPDQSKCDNGTFTMAANTPSVGTGQWSVFAGSATITDPASPTTTVTLTIGTTATLRWTITNAPCDASFDDVVLTYNADNIWVGITSSDWNVGSNWSCGTVPASAASITIQAGTPFSPNIGVSGPNAAITNLTIDNGATLTMSAGYVLTFTSGGTFTNNGTFNAGDGTVVFNGSGTIAGGSTTFNNVTINGGVNFGSNLSTINGTLQINANGFANTNAPRYGSASTLVYNTGGSYNRSVEWNANGVGTIGTTAGYPNNVVLANNTTLALGANSGTGTPRALHGNLTIEGGSTFSMTAGGNMTVPVTVRGNVLIDGTLTLSGAAGGDMNVGGNWTVGTSGTQTNNGRSVQFNSATNATQTITKNGGGTVFFDFLNINNTATNGKVLVSNAPATNLQINSTTNNANLQQLQLNNGELDLNGRTLTLSGTVANSTNIRVANGTRRITGPVGSSINIIGSATAGTQNLNVVPATGSDRLLFDDNVNVQTSVGVVFTNTTINSIFQINQNGFVAGNDLNTDPPVYGVNSTLIYNNGTNGFNRNYEWTAASGTLGTTPGYPNNVIITGTTTPVNLGNGSVSSGIRPLATAGNLTIETGSVATMSAMNEPLTVNGNLTVNGTLTLSTDAAGVLNLAGNWTRPETGSTFTQNGRPIRFIGGNLQTINRTGGETFTLAVVDKSGSSVQLSDNLTISQSLALENGVLDVGGAVLILNDLVTKSPQGELESSETGTVIYNKISGAQDVIFAEYGNLTLTNAATKALANNLAVRGDFTVSGGTVTPGDDIRFSGSRNQSLAGLPNYRNIAMSGAGDFTKTFTSNGAFTGAMTFTDGVGTIDFDGADGSVIFTVVSDALGTARIANVNNWKLAGRAVVERYIPSQRKWRLMSIPVTGETIRQAWTRQADGSYPDPACFGSPLQLTGSGTLITGHSMSSCSNAIDAGFDHVVTGGLSSIRFYNSAQGNPWASATSTPNILAPPAHGGYLMFIRGDRNQLENGSSLTTMRPRGFLKWSDQTVSINQNFVVVGNPYASPIQFEQLYDFNNASGNKTKIKRHYWVWDANLTTSFGGVGGYRSIAPDDEDAASPSYTVSPPLPEGTSVADYLMINSGQAIVVERRDAGGDIEIREAHKFGSAGNLLPFRTTSTPPAKLNINMFRATGSSLDLLMDGVVARFGSLYQPGIDIYDIYKNNQFEENLSLVRNNNYLSIESRPVPTVNDTIFVPFYFTTNRGYALTFKASDMTALNLTAVLQDKFTGTETIVPLNGTELVYPFSVTSNAASRALDRFRVVFTPGAALPVQFTRVRAYPKNAGVQVDWEVGSEDNLAQYEVERSADGRSFSRVAIQAPVGSVSGAAYQWFDANPVRDANFYRIKAVDQNGQFRYSAIVRVSLGMDVKGIRVYPTLVATRTVTLELNDQPAGSYNLQLTNAAGLQVMARRLVHTGGSTTQTLELGDATLRAGLYFLTISNGEGVKQTIKLTLQ